MFTLAEPAVQPVPDYDTLIGLFPEPDGVPAGPVPADRVPEPYRSLLVHDHHMTVTVERFYGGPVDVRVLECRTDGDEYMRKILLVHRATGRVVQFGVVRIDLSVLADAVREQIVAGDTPLGRVLIRNNVLRSVRPTGFVRVDGCPATRDWFGADAATFGRLGVIFTDGRPAIEVLEILAPITGDV